MPLVVVEPLHRLHDLLEPAALVIAHLLRNVFGVVRVQGEVARQDVARQQVHHLRLPVVHRRAGWRHGSEVEHDDPSRPEVQPGRCVQRRELLDDVVDISLEEPDRVLARGGDLQFVEDVAHLIASGLDHQIFEGRNRMALRHLGEPPFLPVDQGVHHVPPPGLGVLQHNAVPRQRGIDGRLDTGPVRLRGAAGDVGTEAVGLVDDVADQLAQAFEGRVLTRRHGGKGQKVLQERLLHGQRIGAAHLQVEDVELVARPELHGHEEGLVLALRSQRLAHQPHEPLGGGSDIGLTDQRQLCPA